MQLSSLKYRVWGIGFLVYFKLKSYRLQKAEKSSSSNSIFQTGELQKSSADRLGARLNFINLSPRNMCMTLFYNRFLTTYHIIWYYWNLPLQYLDNNRNCSHQNSLPLQILKNCSNEWIFHHSNNHILQYSHNWKQHCDPNYIERIWGQSILQFSYGPTCWAIGIS